MANAKEVKIDEGATYEYIRQGLVVVVIGISCFFIHWTLGLPIFIFGIALFAAKTGIIVDVSNNRIKKYSSVFGLKKGNWVDLSNYTMAELILNSNRAKLSTIYQPLYIVRTKPGDAKTFDLIFWDDVESPLLFNQFLKFGLALKTLEAMSKMEFLTIDNKVEDLLLTKRSGRRR